MDYNDPFVLAATRDLNPIPGDRSYLGTQVFVSIVVPTFREADNLTELTERVFMSMRTAGLDGEIVIVDDNSSDGTEAICRELSRQYPLRVIIRRDERGLATAVLAGIEQSLGNVVIVMDADLSHPPEKIPDLVHKVVDGADFVVGSRYVKGGRTDAKWGLFRWLNSKVATLLARGLTTLKDPMAGFFAFPRRILLNAPPMSPVGYKIGLEILTKARCQTVSEVPIMFMERTRGHSKLTLQQQVLYLRHLRRLYRYKYPQTAELMQFVGVGLSGVFIDLVFFLGLTHSHVNHQLARALSFCVAASWNWFLNRWFTFVGGRDKKASKQWVQFLVSATCGFTVNWGTYKFLTDNVAYMANHHLLAFYIGIIMGAGFNYMMSRFFVFRPFDQAIPGKEHGFKHHLDEK